MVIPLRADLRRTFAINTLLFTLIGLTLGITLGKYLWPTCSLPGTPDCPSCPIPTECQNTTCSMPPECPSFTCPTMPEIPEFQSNGTFWFPLTSYSFISNITPNSGDIFSLRKNDSNNLNFTSMPVGKLYLTFQLASIADNLSQIDAFAINFTWWTNRSFVFKAGIYNYSSSSEVALYLCNNANDGWTNWSIPFAGPVAHPSVPSIFTEGLVNNGQITIFFDIPSAIYFLDFVEIVIDQLVGSITLHDLSPDQWTQFYS